MSHQLSFDRAKGFVALPVEICDLDLTPGAFRLLVELCRMANADGFCWPSLVQLSDRMGRSKASISGYLKDLRSNGLIETQEQTTSNGYNYRLKYRVTFWADWRASLRGHTSQPTAQPKKPERSVRPAERRVNSKKQIHINHSPTQSESEIDKVLGDWSTHIAKAPYPEFGTIPASQLVKKSQTIAKETNNTLPDMTTISQYVSDFWKGLRVETPTKAIDEQAELLASKHFSSTEIEHVLAALSNLWKPHWRRFPDLTAFAKLVEKTQIVAQASKQQLLKSHLKRWRLAQNSLRSDVRSGSVSPSSFADLMSGTSQIYPRI